LNFVGVDFAKKLHFGAITCSKGDTTLTPKKFKNGELEKK